MVPVLVAVMVTLELQPKLPEVVADTVVESVLPVTDVVAVVIQPDNDQ